MAAGGTPATRLVEHIALPGDREVLIRPMRPSDAPGIALLYASLEDDDLYLRFFTAHAPPERFVAQLAGVGERGGFGLVAELHEPGRPGRIVAEAAYELLPDGDGELGITVAPPQRGWLGPYLLDRLVRHAGERGVANLHADVLVANRRMVGMLRARGCVVVDHDERPAMVRVAIGASRRTPTWPARHERSRLLVEVPGGRWHAEDAARAAGFDVLACPGPSRGWSTCPALRGEPCPLAAGADVIVDAQRGDLGADLQGAHERLHPTVPLCVELPPAAPGGTPGGTGPPGTAGGAAPGPPGTRPAGPAGSPEATRRPVRRRTERVRAGTDDIVVVGILQRLARRQARPPGQPDPPGQPGP